MLQRKKTLSYFSTAALSFLKVRWSPWSVLAAVALGTLYAILVALVATRLRTPAMFWPVLVLVFWYVFSRWNLLRFAGFAGVLPVAILLFEAFQFFFSPSPEAFRYIAMDHSRYAPNLRVSKLKLHGAALAGSAPGEHGWGQSEIRTGSDGFRASPETGQGNPPRCRWALVGDSVIFGSGLPFSDTLGPLLRQSEAQACVFGVAGNAPVDYLSTLRRVGDRLEPGAQVAVFIYIGNDLVWSPHVVSVAPVWQTASYLFTYLNNWRQSSLTFRAFHGGITSAPKSETLWELPVGESKLWFNQDFSQYDPPPGLASRQRAMLKFFFAELSEMAGEEPWQTRVVFLPNGPELLANLSSEAPAFQDLDPRRVEALSLCVNGFADCQDATPYLYERVLAEGQNPYFIDDISHFSAFGTRVLADYYLSAVARSETRGSATGR